MRFVLALLLAFVIPFNAACAAGAGVCDVLEGRAPHGEHLGHHEHAHDHEHAVTDDKDAGQPACDHNHTHAHPVFSWIVPASLDLRLPAGPPAVVPQPDTDFASAIPPRLERPPRPAPVA